MAEITRNSLIDIEKVKGGIYHNEHYTLVTTTTDFSKQRDHVSQLMLQPRLVPTARVETEQFSAVGERRSSGRFKGSIL